MRPKPTLEECVGIGQAKELQIVPHKWQDGEHQR